MRFEIVLLTKELLRIERSAPRAQCPPAGRPEQRSDVGQRGIASTPQLQVSNALRSSCATRSPETPQNLQARPLQLCACENEGVQRLIYNSYVNPETPNCPPPIQQTPAPGQQDSRSLMNPPSSTPTPETRTRPNDTDCSQSRIQRIQAEYPIVYSNYLTRPECQESATNCRQFLQDKARSNPLMNVGFRPVAALSIEHLAAVISCANNR